MLIEEIPEGQRTIEVQDGRIVTSTRSVNGYRYYDAFALDAVKMPPGQKLAIVSDAPNLGAVEKAE